MTDLERMAAAFTEWTRRYLEEPERFESEWPAADDEDGLRTSGERCAEYLLFLMSEQEAAG